MQNSANNEDLVASDETFEDCIAEGSRFDCAKLSRVTFRRCDMYWASFFLAHLTEELVAAGKKYKEAGNNVDADQSESNEQILNAVNGQDE